MNCTTHNRIALSVAFLGALLFPLKASTATTLFTTLGPADQFDTSSGYLVEGSDYGNQAIATPFSLGASVTIADAVLALGNYQGNNDPVNAYIESDAGGSPGSIVFGLSQAGTIPPSSSDGGLVTFTCNACALSAGSYWLVAQETDPDTVQEWYFAYLDPQETIEHNGSGSATGPWYAEPSRTTPGFEIDAGVPEPGSLSLLGIGLLSLVMSRRVRRRR